MRMMHPPTSFPTIHSAASREWAWLWVARAETAVAWWERGRLDLSPPTMCTLEISRCVCL